jgi:hypothetical protein
MLSIGELADRVEPGSARLGTVHARIQGWVREGLLRDWGGERTGTGHHRRFDEKAVCVVAVLNILADFDMTIGAMVRAPQDAGQPSRRVSGPILLGLLKEAIAMMDSVLPRHTFLVVTWKRARELGSRQRIPLIALGLDYVNPKDPEDLSQSTPIAELRINLTRLWGEQS